MTSTLNHTVVAVSALELGASRDLGAQSHTYAYANVGQGDETWVVLTDPERNVFCVLAPRPG